MTEKKDRLRRLEYPDPETIIPFDDDILADLIRDQEEEVRQEDLEEWKRVMYTAVEAALEERGLTEELRLELSKLPLAVSAAAEFCRERGGEPELALDNCMSAIYRGLCRYDEAAHGDLDQWLKQCVHDQLYTFKNKAPLGRRYDHEADLRFQARLERLTPEEKEIAVLVLGLNDSDALLPVEVAQKLGITPEEARERRSAVLRRLRELKEEEDRAVDTH